MAIELATAYVSLVPETSKLEAAVKQAFTGVGKHADVAGQEMGSRLAKTASKALKDGWRPDQDIMAGIPNTKLDRVGARIGQVIGKGIAGGIRAQQLGRDFGHSFASGAGSIGLGSVIAGWHSDLKGQSNKLGYLAGKALSAGMTAAVGAGVAGVGIALKTGFDRLVALDTAQYKLKQVLKSAGRDAKDFDKINAAVQKSVDKTPFSLDQAFNTAVQAIGAGAQDIERFMTDVADAAGFAGTDLERMGLIFNQVLAKGRLTGEETMQLMEAGLPARSWIQKSYNLTSEQFDKMQQNGEITLDMLQKSIEDHAPGMAKALGNTLQGSIDNMQTALARTGANFLAAVFGGPTGDPTEGLKSAVQRLTEMLNNLNVWITAHKEDIKQFFEGAKTAAADVIRALGDIASLLREHPGLITAAVTAFVAFETIKGIATVATALGAINTALGLMPGAAATATSSLGPLSAILTTIAGAYLLLKDTPQLGNKGTVGNGGGIVPPLIGNGPGGIFGPKTAENGVLPTAPGMINGSTPTIGGIPIPGLQMPNQPSVKGSPGKGFPLQWPMPSGSGADRWRPSIKQALAQYGPGLGISNYSAWEDALVRQIVTESGGNPKADNPNDSNGQGGKQHVSGLLQFLPSTFASHNISGGAYLDPNAQIAAALSYVMSRYGVDANGAPLQIGRGVGYDTGGWLPPGTTTVDNNTGKPELVLNPDQVKALAEQGVDPASVLHGTGQGAAPGPAAGAVAQQEPNYGMDFVRSLGFVPASAGNTSVAGTSSLAKFIGMGNDVVGGLIDTGTNLAQTAVSAAITAGAIGGSFGGAAPAAPVANAAASYGIQLAGQTAKRLSAYGFQMLGIGADALVEQLFPFGAPRWLGYDYAQFAPQLGIQQAFTSTIEKMGTDAINKAFPQPGQPAGPGGNPAPAGPVNPAMMPGAPPPPAPNPNDGPDLTASGPSQAAPLTNPLANIPPDPLAGLFGYDQGGMLPPGGVGINMTSRPEPVLTPQQWDAIAASSSSPMTGAPLVENLYAQDMQDAIRQLEKVKRRDMMQYARVS